MQYVNCKLLLNSDRNFEIPMKAIPVAEVVLLRMIHGPESVQDIQDSGKNTMSLPQCRTMLIEKYGAGSADGVKRIDAMFASVHMQGLTKISDILQGEAAAAAAGKGKSAAKGVAATDLADPDDDPAE